MKKYFYPMILASMISFNVVFSKNWHESVYRGFSWGIDGVMILSYYSFLQSKSNRTSIAKMVAGAGGTYLIRSMMQRGCTKLFNMLDNKKILTSQ